MVSAGCSEVAWHCPGLGDHSLPPDSAIWVRRYRPRTQGYAASARCRLRAQEAARTPHQMHIVSLFL